MTCCNAAGYPIQHRECSDSYLKRRSWWLTSAGVRRIDIFRCCLSLTESQTNSPTVKFETRCASCSSRLKACDTKLAIYLDSIPIILETQWRSSCLVGCSWHELSFYPSGSRPLPVADSRPRCLRNSNSSTSLRAVLVPGAPRARISSHGKLLALTLALRSGSEGKAFRLRVLVYVSSPAPPLSSSLNELWGQKKHPPLAIVCPHCRGWTLCTAGAVAPAS